MNRQVPPTTVEPPRHRILRSGVFCVAVLAVFSFVFGCLGEEATGEKTTLYETLFFLAIALCTAVVLYSAKQGTLTEGKLVFVFFLLVFLARLCYIRQISILQYQHDTSYFGKPENNYGHTGYIKYLLDTGRLPNFDPRGKSQFYHPPLHHLLCALWMKLQMSFGASFEVAAENLQALTLFYSMVTLFAAYRILKHLHVSGTPLWVALAILGFHPTFFLFSGSINNDCLSLMFSFLAIWASLAWFEKQTYARILAIAVTLGLSMFAKLNAGILAPAIAFLFLYRFVYSRGWKPKLRLIGQFGAFALVCIPLGIGWQLYHFFAFGTPLAYVPKLSLQADQYLGRYTAADRLFDFGSLWDFGVYPSRAGMQDAWYFEHCIPLSTLKMALFGEYSVWKNRPLLDACGNALFWTNLSLVLTSLAGLVCGAVQAVRRTAEEFREKIGFSKQVFAFFLFAWGVAVVLYVKFAFDYPHFCSMDFRYIAATVLYGTVGLAILLRVLPKERYPRACNALKAGVLAASGLFAALSCVLYLALPLANLAA